MRQNPMLNRFFKTMHQFAGPGCVSAFATWMWLSFGLTQLIPEATWLYALGSALLLTVGIALTVLGTFMVMLNNPEE